MIRCKRPPTDPPAREARYRLNQDHSEHVPRVEVRTVLERLNVIGKRPFLLDKDFRHVNCGGFQHWLAPETFR